MRRSMVVSTVIVLAASVFRLSAQEAPAAPQMVYVHRETAKPALVAEYERSTREFVALVKQHADPSFPFTFTAVAGDSFDYYYVLPLSGFGDIDKINQFFTRLGEKLGKEKYAEFMRQGAATIDHNTESVALMRPDLSYRPAQPRLKPEDVRTIHYDFYYFAADQEDAAAENAKTAVELFKSKGLSDGFTVYQGLMGADLPLFVVTTVGTSPEDVLAARARSFAALGEPWQALNRKVRAILRRYETRLGQIRPDLSNPPPPAAPAKK